MIANLGAKRALSPRYHAYPPDRACSHPSPLTPRMTDPLRESTLEPTPRLAPPQRLRARGVQPR